MRKIKFRGKRYDSEKWIYGNLVDDDVILTRGCLCVDDDYIGFDDDWSSVKPETVGQFTGLLDGNGKEIYEGDILQFEEYPPAQVLWYDGAFNARRLDINDDYILADWYDGTVIIGNIHDNPELAEGIEL